MTEPLMPPDPGNLNASIAEAMLQFNDTMEPVLAQAKAMRLKLVTDGWNPDMAEQVSSGVMVFWLNQYMSLMSRAVQEVTLVGATAPSDAS